MFCVVEKGGNPKLRQHVNATYFTLRWGVVALTFAFPLVLAIGGAVFGGVEWQNSMSAYYHANAGGQGPGAMRDWFVGFLFALGALMYLYKGFTRTENVFLNVASVLAVCVALIPMQWPEKAGGGMFSLHGICAIGAFVCLALVAWLSPGRSLQLMPDEAKRRKYAGAYRVIALSMLLFPLVAFLLAALMGDPGKFVFVAEALGLFAFTAYWVTKSLEMRDTQGELKALQGVVAERLLDEEPPRSSVRSNSA